MKMGRVAFYLAVGAGLMGCGEPVPSIGEARVVDPPVASQPNETTVVGKQTRAASFTAGDSNQYQDFLFVFDDSGSMRPEVDTVQSQLSNFFASLNSRRNVDYRVAVTTTNVWLDNGALYSGSGGYDVLSPSTPNVLSEFSSILNRIKNNIANSNSRMASGVEMGWLAAERAIRNNGYRFMRNGVPLAIVILSDATDSSRRCFNTSNGPRCDDAPYSTDRFVDFFRDLKSPSQVPVKSLLYPLASRRGDECDSLEGDEANWDALGDRYKEVQSRVGTGFMGSICQSALSSHLNEIGSRISSRGICYDLSGGADAVLEVRVGGQKIEASAQAGYQFDASTASVCFAGSYQPPTGQLISVIYQTPN